MDIAQVSEFSISQEDFLERYQQFLASTGVKDSPIVREQILNHMINEILLAKLDNNEHIINSQDYINATELIWKELLLSYYKEKEIYEKIEITDKELREAFVKVNEKISARHLYARTLEEANRLYQQVQSGMTFEQLAPLVFEDKELSQNGGYLGYFTWGDMDPAFEEAAYSLKIGQISRPVQTAYGYSIIKVEDRFKNPILTESEFNRKKNSLRRLIGINKIKKSEKEFLNNILNELSIEINESSLKEIMRFRSNNNMDAIGDNETIVKFAGGSFSVSDALKQLQNIAESNRKRINSEQTLKAALKGLVLQQWLIKDAQKKNYDHTEEFKRKYNQWTFGELILFKKQDLEKSIHIPDSTIEKYYKNHKKEFLTEEKINVQEILITSRDEADNIIQLLKKGEDFAQLAQKNTIRKWAAANGGILGLSPISRFGYFKKYLKNLPIKNIIGPIHVDDFYVIARIIDRKEPEQISLNDMRDTIKETLRQEKKREQFSEYIRALREKYPVVINQNLIIQLDISV